MTSMLSNTSRRLSIWFSNLECLVCRQMTKDWACLCLMGRVGLAAAASTFTMGWDETEFGTLMWWVVEMEDGMKGDKGGLIWCPYLREPVIMEEE
jgi:hypothetical protein